MYQDKEHYLHISLSYYSQYTAYAADIWLSTSLMIIKGPFSYFFFHIRLFLYSQGDIYAQPSGQILLRCLHRVLRARAPMMQALVTCAR